MKTKVESFDDIVFENRNQEYGAYELRKKYSKRGVVALVISFILLFFAVGGPLLASIMNNIGPIGNYIPKNGTIVLTDPYEKKPEVVLAVIPPQPVDVKAIKFVAPKIVDELTDEEADLPTTDEYFERGNSELGDTAAVTFVDSNPRFEVTEIDTVEIFELNEKPFFPDLIKYIAEHTNYPTLAVEGGIEGTVYIRFVVTKTGNIGDAKILRGADPLLDDEALRVVKTLPRWTPGKINGNPVSVWFIIPVKFKLQ